jgi:DNA-directed RNA polymerase I subunit RPA2
MLIIQKRNYPVAFLRPSYTNRGPGYTEFAVQMRCVRDDFYAKTFTLHYIADGNIYLRILYKKQEFLIPIIIILKAIGGYSDREIYTRLMKGHYQDSDRSDKIEVLLKTGRSLGLYNQTQFLEYLGKNFRLLLGISTHYTDKEAGEIFLTENICPHLSLGKEKFNTICLAIDKLYALVNG